MGLFELSGLSSSSLGENILPITANITAFSGAITNGIKAVNKLNLEVGYARTIKQSD